MKWLHIAAVVIWFAIIAAAHEWVCSTPGPVPFKENGKWGYLSAEGIVIPPRFDVAAPFTKEGAVVCIAKQCGRIDRTGAFISPPVDSRSVPIPSSRVVEGLAPAVKRLSPDGRNDKWGFIDGSGRVVIPYQFTFAHDFHDGIAAVGLNGKTFFINRAGDRVTPEFDGVYDFSEDLAAVDVAGKIGYIRRDGSFALPPIYHSASGISFSEGLVAVRVNGKVGFMDKAGTVVIEPAYDDVYPFSEGLAPVRLMQNWGYIDRSGRVVIPIRFGVGHMFAEGVASVSLGGKWGYIDHAGAFAIPATFDSAMPFCAGVAQVETYRWVGEDTSHGCRAGIMQGKQGFIDHSGRYVWRDAVERTWTSPFCF